MNILIPLLSIIFGSALASYIVFFFMDDMYEQAETRKEFILQWTVPFYWWGIMISSFIKEQIKIYKGIKK